MPKSAKSKPPHRKQPNNNKRAKRSASPLTEHVHSLSRTQSPLRLSVEPPGSTPAPFSSSRTQSLDPASRPSSRGRSVEFAEFTAGSRANSRSRHSISPPPPPRSPSLHALPDTSSPDLQVPHPIAAKGARQVLATAAAARQAHPPLVKVDPETNTDVIALENFLALNSIQKIVAENDIIELDKIRRAIDKHPAVWARFLYSRYEAQDRTKRLAEIGIDEAEFDEWIASDLENADADEVSALESSLQHLPEPQSVIRLPRINWARYGVVPQQRNMYGPQNPEHLGPISLASYRVPNPAPYHPQPSANHTNVPKDGYQFNWKQLEGSPKLRSNPSLDDYTRLQTQSPL